jgi:hypothetical protein
MKYFLILTSIFFILSCDLFNLDEESSKFKWVKKGSELTYNFYSRYETIDSALTIDFLPNTEESLMFEYNYKNGGTNRIIASNFLIYREEDGLYSSTPKTCVPPSYSSMKFLRVPATPKLNKLYTQYVCGEVWTSLKVISVEENIVVPLGTFEVFVLQDTLTKVKEYWSEKEGLIKIVNKKISLLQVDKLKAEIIEHK